MQHGVARWVDCSTCQDLRIEFGQNACNWWSVSVSVKTQTDQCTSEYIISILLLSYNDRACRQNVYWRCKDEFRPKNWSCNNPLLRGNYARVVHNWRSVLRGIPCHMIFANKSNPNNRLLTSGETVNCSWRRKFCSRNLTIVRPRMAILFPTAENTEILQGFNLPIYCGFWREGKSGPQCQELCWENRSTFEAVPDGKLAICQEVHRC